MLIPVKCNQHPWMKAYIGVMKHPFFAVSDDDGAFEIKGVPPGTYTVVAWREGGANGEREDDAGDGTGEWQRKLTLRFGAQLPLRLCRRCR